MKMFYYYLNFIAIVFFIQLPIGLIAQKNSSSESIYQSILKEPGLSEKERLGNLLGKKGNPSFDFTMKLLKDESYWNRIAGIKSASQSSNDLIDKEILNLFVTDHMTTSETKEFVVKKFPKFENEFIDIYGEESSELKKRQMADIIPNPPSQKMMLFLKSEINKGNQSSRDIAFNTIARPSNLKGSIHPEDTFLRSLLNDKSLRINSLEYIQKSGSNKDLKVFLDVLEKDDSNFSEKSISLRAVKDWGTLQDQLKQYENILKNLYGDDASLYLAIQIFPDIKSEFLRKNLCKVALGGASQELRISASMSLILYDTKENLDCFERIVQEKVDPSPPTSLRDAIAVVFTFGIAGFKMANDENKRRVDFFTRQERIREHLKYLKQK